MKAKNHCVSAVAPILALSTFGVLASDMGCSSSSPSDPEIRDSGPDPIYVYRPDGASATDASTDAPTTKQYVDLTSVWPLNAGGSTQASFAVFQSTGAGFAVQSNWPSGATAWVDGAKWVSGDFNGDGLTDIASISSDGATSPMNNVTVRLSTGTTFSASPWATSSGPWHTEGQWFAGDFDGDGYDDVATIFNGGSDTVSIDLYLSATDNGQRTFSAPQHWVVQNGWWNGAIKWLVGDFDGDHIPDIADIWPDAGYNGIAIWLSRKTHFDAQGWTPIASDGKTPTSGVWVDDSFWLAGDFDGDHKSDLVQVWNNNGHLAFAPCISNGTTFLQSSRWGDVPNDVWVASPNVRWLAADFTGDGRADLAEGWLFTDSDNNTYNNITMRQSTGSAFSSSSWATKMGGWSGGASWVLGKFRQPVTVH